MKMVTIISEEEYVRIRAAIKANKNKRVAKKLEVLELRHAGMSNAEIALRTGYNRRYVTTLMGQYKKQGLDEFIRIKQTSHNRNMSVSEEAEVLAACEKEAEEGHVLTAAEVQGKLEERLGRESGHNYPYRVMKRHGWRKVMPRSRHPKAATKEEQDSSKKLKPCTPKSLPKTQAKTFD